LGGCACGYQHAGEQREREYPWDAGGPFDGVGEGGGGGAVWVDWEGGGQERGGGRGGVEFEEAGVYWLEGCGSGGEGDFAEAWDQGV